MADKALLVGINDYRWISDLRGCVNDVQNVKSLLVEVFGFAPQNVRTLANGEVTKERVQEQWHWLLRDAAPGNRLVFHFSGHGSYTTDLDDDEPDGVDEVLCLHDMDWEDSQTYFLDDEMRAFTSRAPRGAFLTVLLDCCHSGTATRMLLAPGVRGAVAPEKAPLIDLETSIARLSGSGRQVFSMADERSREEIHRVLAPRDLREAQQTILARFVQPPPKIQATLHRAGVRSSFRDPRSDRRDEAGMNHVLFAGSKATQTSADAYIANDFHGAFTYYFCQCARAAGRAADHQSVIQRVRETLSFEQFSQIPQLEPEATRGLLFEWGHRQEPAAPGGGDDLESAETRRELISLMRDIREVLEHIKLPHTDRLVSGQRALVYVHGICRHDKGYSDPWWHALWPHLSSAVRDNLQANRREVLWSDLVTLERERFAAVPRSHEEESLAERLREVLEDRAAQQAVVAAPEHEGSDTPRAAHFVADRAVLGIPGLDCIDDFVKYLLNDDIRRAVQQRFLDQVEPVLRSGAHVEVIGHSWGTVVAFEALRRLDAQNLEGRVRNFFTVGSALSIVPVKRLLRPDDGRRPRHVERWVNLDARGDIVGGPLRGQPFEVDVEYLNLHSTGCDTFFTIVAPACAHSSYFHNDNTPVNRDIFARHIED